MVRFSSRIRASRVIRWRLGRVGGRQKATRCRRGRWWRRARHVVRRADEAARVVGLDERGHNHARVRHGTHVARASRIEGRLVSTTARRAWRGRSGGRWQMVIWLAKHERLGESRRRMMLAARRRGACFSRHRRTQLKGRLGSGCCRRCRWGLFVVRKEKPFYRCSAQMSTQTSSGLFDRF